MAAGQVALEWGIIAIIFYIIFGKIANSLPFLKDWITNMRKKKDTPSIINPMEVKQQVWPQNRAMI